MFKLLVCLIVICAASCKPTELPVNTNFCYKEIDCLGENPCLTRVPCP